MTLCIAAHCREGIIIGVSDRMLSRGQALRHLPPSTKAHELYDSICCLYSGGVTLTNSIVQVTQHALAQRFAASGEECTVQRAAHVFRECYNAARIVEAANEVLPKYLIAGMDAYHAKRPTLPKKTVRSIERRIDKWQFDEEEDVAVIIFGVDSTGPHIYEIVYGDLACRDGLGFAAIGADTDTPHHFLHDNQGYSRPFGEAIVLAYVAASLAANPASGIGPPADVLLVGPERSSLRFVEQLGMWRLAGIYDAAFVRGLGGLGIALTFGSQLTPDARLGMPMPPSLPDPAAEPQSPPESTHG